MRRNLLAATLLATFLPIVAVAQPTPPQGSLTGSSSVATGATTFRTDSERAAEVVNVRDFGAKGDGATDDTVAIQAAITRGRTIYNADDRTGFTLYFPPGVYVVSSNTINFTNFSNKGPKISGRGATLWGKIAGKPVLDLTGWRWADIDGLYVYGDNTVTPSYGILYQRAGVGAGDSACSNGSWQNVTTNGKFLVAGVYIMSCETTKYYVLHAFNSNTAPNTYGLVLDGVNHFNIGSAFTTPTTPVPADTFRSFNEPNFYGLMATSQSATGGAAVWLSGTSRMNWTGAYTASASDRGIIVYSKDSTNTVNDWTFDALIETNTGALNYDLFLTGPNPTPTMNGLRWRSQASNAHIAWALADTGITHVGMAGADIDFDLMGGSEVVFAQPSLWSVSGHYRLPVSSLAWNLLDSQFNGMGVIGQIATFYGDGSKLTGVIAQGGGTGSGTAINNDTIFAAHVRNGGSVDHLVLNGVGSTHGGTYNLWKAGNNGAFPAITVGPPAPGGVQAAAHVTAMSLASTTGSTLVPVAANSGYVNGHTLTAIGGTLTGNTPFVMLITGVDGNGKITSVSPLNNGQSYSVPPPEPITFVESAGGTGTGAQLINTTWNVLATAMDIAGNGYATAPPITFAAGIGPGASTAIAVAVLTKGVTIGNATEGYIEQLADRVNLGSAGITGMPVVAASAQHDSSATIVTAPSSGATQTAAANSDGMFLNNSSLVAAQTVVLPPITGIPGQVFLLGSLGGVTSLTTRTALGGGVGGAPAALSAGGGSVLFRTDGTTWFPVMNTQATAATPPSVFKLTRRTISSGASTDTATTTDGQVNWNSNSGGPKVETIPACSTPNDGQTLVVKGLFGDEDINPILILPTSGTIDRTLTSVAINGVRGSITFNCDSSLSTWTMN